MNKEALRARSGSLILTAVVAGVFSLIACVALVFNFVHRVPDPLSEPSYLDLKAELRSQPDRDELKQSLRELDQTLRADYFRRLRFTSLGAYLLIGGIAVAVAAAKTVETLQRRLPQPVPASTWHDPDARLSRLASWGVSGLTGLLIAAAIGLSLGYRSLLPHSVQQLPGLLASQAEAPPTPDKVPDEAVGKSEAAAGGKSVNAKPGPSAPSTPDKPADTVPATVGDPAQNWPRFRGPMGSGIAPTADVPSRWDVASGEGVLWKTPVPLPGNSSPVIWGDKVFLTGGTEEKREVYCLNTSDGRLLWTGRLPDSPAGTEPPKVTEDTGYAAPTAVTDGERVYAIFPTGDLAAFDFSGQQTWLRSFGLPQNPYGHAASLAMYEKRLLVILDQGPKNEKLSRLWALDPANGKNLWEVTRDVPSSWATPIVLDHEGQPQLITCGDPWVIAYDPRDGKELWRTKSLRQDVGPSPIAGPGHVYVANESPGISAIRLGGTGDVTGTHVAWEADIGAPDTCSPLLAGDLLLMLASYGTLTCYDAAQGGDPLWEEDLEENFQSSPSLAGDKVYLFAQSGKWWVIQATRDKCTRVSEGELGEDCVASPAFQKDRMYVRAKEHLFCLGK